MQSSMLKTKFRVKICVLKGSHGAITLIKCLFFKYHRKKNPQDPWSAIYGLPMFVFFVQVCACVEGWMVENEEFCDIFVHYQYADYDQYEPSMHRKRSMLHKTLDTAEPSDI